MNKFIKGYFDAIEENGRYACHPYLDASKTCIFERRICSVCGCKCQKAITCDDYDIFMKNNIRPFSFEYWKCENCGKPLI